jgi:hypothetical protein
LVKRLREEADAALGQAEGLRLQGGGINLQGCKVFIHEAIFSPGRKRDCVHHGREGKMGISALILELHI